MATKQSDGKIVMIKGVEIHYLKADPKKPNAAFNAENPTWEVQLRTTSLEQRDAWKKQGLQVKKLTKTIKAEDPEDDPTKEPVMDENGKQIFRVNLKKPSKRKSKEKPGMMEPAEPVKVIRGDLSDVEPGTVGNGSKGNVRVFQYSFKDKKTGEDVTTSMLLAIQLTHHVVYVAKPRESDFDMTDTTIEQMANEEDNDMDDDEGTGAPQEKKSAPAPARGEDDF
jgi:hypothetical protein